MKELFMFVFITLSLLIGNDSVTYIEKEDQSQNTTFTIFRTYPQKEYIRELEEVFVVTIHESDLRAYGMKLVDIVGEVLLYDIPIDDIEIDGNGNRVTFRVRETSFNKSGVAQKFSSLGDIEFKDGQGGVFRLSEIADITIIEMEKHLN